MWTGDRRNWRTVGDIRIAPFIEAIRQMRQELAAITLCWHVTLCRYWQPQGVKTSQRSTPSRTAQRGNSAGHFAVPTDRFLSKTSSRRCAVLATSKEEAVITAKDVASSTNAGSYSRMKK